MKNKLKILTTGVISALILPSVVNAANLTFSNNAIVDGNKTTYQIITNEEITDPNIQLQIYKSNDSSDLKYEMKSTYGSCDIAKLECTLVFPSGIPAGNELASITVTNDGTEKKEITLKINGSDASKTFTVEPNQVNTPTTTTKQRSNDASLSSISVSNGTFDQAFNRDITSYNITGIKDTVNSVTVTPECDNNCSWDITCPTGDCTISNSRKVSLRTGANQVGINVTSEDGTSKKTYILNIYRGEIVTNSAYLSSIKITDAKLSPNFDSLVNDYTTTVGLEVDKLDIVTVAEDPNADVIIKGNENLVEGENTITITVTSSDGANKQVYTIIVTKKEIKKTSKKKVVTKTVKKKTNKTPLIIIISIIGVGLIIGAYFLIFRLKKNKKKGKDNKNDKNNKGTSIKTENEEKESSNETNEVTNEVSNESSNPYENTGNIDLSETETSPSLEELNNDEDKQDIDEALDDLMQTKKLELGDLDF